MCYISVFYVTGKLFWCFRNQPFFLHTYVFDFISKWASAVLNQFLSNAIFHWCSVVPQLLYSFLYLSQSVYFISFSEVICCIFLNFIICFLFRSSLQCIIYGCLVLLLSVIIEPLPSLLLHRTCCTSFIKIQFIVVCTFSLFLFHILASLLILI